MDNVKGTEFQDPRQSPDPDPDWSNNPLYMANDEMNDPNDEVPPMSDLPFFLSGIDSTNAHVEAPTVLPARSAKLISYWCKGATLCLRLGTYLTETALDSTRVSMLSSLGVSRRIIENILSKADEDSPGATRWAVTCTGFVNDTTSLAHFITSAAFHLGNTLVSTVSYLSQDFIHIFNSIFGSTDSSRAIASILSLIQRELGDQVGVYALATALVVFSVVQSRIWKRTLENIEMYVLWDVVVLDSGETLSQQQMPEKQTKRDFEDHGIISRIAPGSHYKITADHISSDTMDIEILKEHESLPTSASRTVTASSAASNTPNSTFSGERHQSGIAQKESPNWQWPPELDIPPGAVILNEEATTKVVNGKAVSSYKLKFENRTRRYRERRGQVRSVRDIPDGHKERIVEDSTVREVDEKVEPLSSMSPMSDDSDTSDANSMKKQGQYDPILKASQETPANFPPGHLTYNMAKYVRFASASYGHSFMRLLGLGLSAVNFPRDNAAGGAKNASSHHSEHYAFAHHARLRLDQILLSSYTEITADGTSGLPLVHFLAVDHEAKSIVLTIRGTLGLDDLLTDLTCDYSTFEWQGQSWTAHGGMLKCAQQLTSPSSRVLQTIASALRQWGPEYGLILCGHSLGGGVAALLGILLSEVEASSVTEGNEDYSIADTKKFVTSRKTIIPAGRPIRCFTYGPPASICSSLRLATRSLIISVVYGLDIVPCLSLGLLHDFQSLAGVFKSDKEGIVDGIRKRFMGQTPIRGPLSQQPERDDDYLFTIMTALRSVMNNEKLVPPGQVYHINTSAVFEIHDGHTRKATRVVGRLVVDVDKRFREPVFGREIFHHSPIYYERALNTLEQGISQAPI